MESNTAKHSAGIEKFKKFWAPIDNVVFSILMYVCAALLAIVFYIFIGRYILRSSPMWGEPLSLFLLTWMSILGSALVLRTDEHLKVTMFDSKMSPKAIMATEILGTVCIAVFAVFMIVYGIQLMIQARSNSMAGVNIPYRFMYLSLPVTGILYFFALVSQWMRRLDKK